MEKFENALENANNNINDSTEKSELFPVFIEDDKQNSSTESENSTENEEQSQFKAYTKDDVYVDEGDYPEDDPYHDDLLLETGEYYHDHENYPIDVRFKHPFMNIISLICGILSSICCICSCSAPILQFIPAVFILPSLLLAIIGIGLFVFDLVKSNTVNGLSISGLVISVLGGALSLVNLIFIAITFILTKIFPAVATLIATIGGGTIAFITAIGGGIVAIITAIIAIFI